MAIASIGTLLSAPTASAQPATDAEPVVIVANRLPQPLSSVLADVSIVDRAAIERSGAVDVADVLATLPGITVSRSGGPGAATGIFLRGGESRFTAVYLDGVRVDSQGTGGAPWEQIPLDQIERIEVLRGPAAAVYGSDAVSGVVQLVTRRGRGPLQPSASLTAGTQGLLRAQAAVQGTGGSVDYAASIHGGRASGFDARPGAGNPDRDGWRRAGAQARVGVQLAPEHRLEGSLSTSSLRTQFDGFTPKQDDVAQQRLANGSIAWQARWNDDAQTRVQLGRTTTRYEQQPDFYATQTRLTDLNLQHAQRTSFGTFTALLDRREDALSNAPTDWTPLLEGTRHQTGAGLGWRGDFGAHGLQVQVRHDRDSMFGSRTTGGLAWGWAFAPGWRTGLSAATAFRAPTLYQLYSSYGQATLQPETGRTLEASLRWAEGSHSAGIVVWRQRLAQMIGFGSPGVCADSFGCYRNTGRAAIDGATLSAGTQAGPVRLDAALDWLDARDLEAGTQLPRRARQQARVAATLVQSGWDVGVEWRGVGARFDDNANQVRMGGYGVANLVAGTTLMPGLRLSARIDNLAGKDWESAFGYATGGRTAQVSLNWAMR